MLAATQHTSAAPSAQNEPGSTQRSKLELRGRNPREEDAAREVRLFLAQRLLYGGHMPRKPQRKAQLPQQRGAERNLAHGAHGTAPPDALARFSPEGSLALRPGTPVRYRQGHGGTAARDRIAKEGGSEAAWSAGSHPLRDSAMKSAKVVHGRGWRERREAEEGPGGGVERQSGGGSLMPRGGKARRGRGESERGNGGHADERSGRREDRGQGACSNDSEIADVDADNDVGGADPDDDAGDAGKSDGDLARPLWRQPSVRKTNLVWTEGRDGTEVPVRVRKWKRLWRQGSAREWRGEEVEDVVKASLWERVP